MNLLTDPLLRTETSDGLRRLSLPELMAALGRDQVEHLPGLQRHQEDAFHVFLCYLAGAVLDRGGDTDVIHDAQYWQDGLRSLAGQAGDDAWTLVVPDLSRPAFMQPPLPPEDHDRLRPIADTPDALDLLPTAKNHDLKQTRAVRADPDAWVYALVSLQTMSGFYGVGNRGISRMNGGFGNRPIVEVVRSFRPGARWRDAVLRLLEHRREVLGAEYSYDPRGIVLVWVEPWDGRTALPLTRLDPFYVEVCRRVRLKGDDRPTHAEAVASVADRIAAGELRGAVGDAWLPIDLRESSSRKDAGVKALTVGPRGWDADLIRRLIFADELKLSPLQRPDVGWQGDVWLSASVLVRGQGTTDGFHERRIAIPEAARLRVFGPPERRQPLAELSKTAIEYAGQMQNRVLRPAVLTYMAAATSATDRDSFQTWWRGAAGRFQALWTDAFFNWLWSVPDPVDQRLALSQWARQLRDYALEVLREAERVLPKHVGRRFGARAAAERRFWTALYANGNFPFLREESRDHVGVA